jgi:hypothetical protein
VADNVNVTAGSGTIIATDDIGGGVQVQRIKPVWGVDGVGTDTSATNPLPVSVPAIVKITQTPTVSTTPAYTAKDAVGGLLTFANAVRVSGGNGTLVTVTVIDNSQQRPSLELVLFDRTFTNSTDNAIFEPSDADLANCIGVVAINSWSDFSTNSIATVSAVGLGFVLNGTSLFGQLLTRGTPTFVATSDIVVAVDIAQS